MTTRVWLEPVFVLHQRPYRNSSLIVELLSLNYGRLSAIARSARGPKSRYKGYLQLFSPLLISWSASCELASIQHVELAGSSYQLNGASLWCGFYLNELLLRLLPREDPAADIFFDYQHVLSRLESNTEKLEVALRCYEKCLLERLGYGLVFTHEMQTNEPIIPEAFYRWLPDKGFLRCISNHSIPAQLFSGRSLLAFHEENWNNNQDLAAAKRLMREVLRYHLGGKPLKSRELMRKGEEIN